MNYLIRILCFSVVFLSLSSLQAQTRDTILLNAQTSGTRVNTCNATFYDSGGPVNSNGSPGNYRANENYFITLCPNMEPGSGIRFSFKDFQVRNVGASIDSLIIYDGPDTLSPRLRVGSFDFFTDVLNKPEIDSLFTAINPSGCFTFHFKSDAVNQGRGWEISIDSCRFPCQKVEISLKDTFYTLLSDGSRIPHPVKKEISDNQTFWYYDICSQDSIEIGATFNFPENDKYYHQSAEELYTEWDLGDKVTIKKGMGDTSATHRYPFSKAYTFFLDVRDKQACPDDISGRVRIAYNPIREVPPLTEICSGENVLLEVGPLGDILTNTVAGNSGAIERFMKESFIPDGKGCNDDKTGSTCYNNSVKFTTFGAAKITSEYDICAICIKLEHSYVGDLSIRLICPDTTKSVMLLYDPTWGYGKDPRTFGVPYLGDDGSHGDSKTDNCSPEENPMGIPFQYCWSQNENFTKRDHKPIINLANTAAGKISGSKITTNGWPTTSKQVIDSSDYEARSRFYTPLESFKNLIGCPMNGVWNIEICDMTPTDNGWITEWSLDLCSPRFMPWSYEVPLDSVIWEGEGIQSYNAKTGIINQDRGGEFTYQAGLLDRFGCIWDTNMSQISLQTPILHIGNDTLLCDAAPLRLDAGCDTPVTPFYKPTYLWAPTGDTNCFILSDPDLTNNKKYSVQVINKGNAISCISVDDILITLGDRALPSMSPTPYPLEGCEPFKVSFENSTIHEASFSWNFGDGHRSTEREPSHIYARGTHPLSLTSISKDGCKDSVTALVHVYSSPKPDFRWDPIYPTVKEPFTQFINKTEPLEEDNIYVWKIQTQKNNPNAIQKIEDSTDVFFQWSGSGKDLPYGNYKAQLFASTENTGPSGAKYECIDSIDYQIRILNDFLQFPNAVSPNGDGINDVFKITSLVEGMAYPNNELAIFDRNGRRIFFQKNIKLDTDFWDPRETNTPSGTYFFRFIGKGYQNDVEFKGSIEVLYK